jgi:serine protease Do
MIRRCLAVLFATGLVLGLVSCGGGDDDSADTTVASTDTTTPDNTAAPTTTAADGTTTTAGAGDAITLDNFGSAAGITEDAEAYADFVEITDDSGALVVEVPSEWSDVDGTASSSGDPSVQASPDLAGDIAVTPVLGYTAVEFTTPPDLDNVITQTADATTGGECQAQPAADYADGVFSGRVQAFVGCGGDDRAWIFVAATPDNGDSYATVIFGQAVTTADVDAIQHAFDTFNTTL